MYLNYALLFQNKENKILLGPPPPPPPQMLKDTNSRDMSTCSPHLDRDLDIH